MEMAGVVSPPEHNGDRTVLRRRRRSRDEALFSGLTSKPDPRPRHVSHPPGLAFCSPPPSGSVHADARDALQRFTSGLTGCRAVHPAGLRHQRPRARNSSGEVALSAPRLFRWEYTQPYPQLIVADGERVWVFDPDLDQVTVRPQRGGAEQSAGRAHRPGDPGARFTAGSRRQRRPAVAPITPRETSDAGSRTRGSGSMTTAWPPWTWSTPWASAP